jgi:hypothetical protein
MKLLESLAKKQPAGGTAGTLGQALEDDTFTSLVDLDSYRPGLPAAKSLMDIWPLVVLMGATLFFADVFVRRVAIDLGLPLRILADQLRAKRNKSEAMDQERKSRLDRLRTTKSTASGDLDKQRSASQIDLDATAPSGSVPGTSASDSFGIRADIKKRNQENTPTMPGIGVEEEQSYTSRLLDAKRKAKKNQ